MSNQPTLPKNSLESEKPFTAPWQAQAFAMAVMLNEKGLFTWDEWATVFSQVLEAAGPDDDPDNYYLHWMEALEKISEMKGLTASQELLERQNQWDKAAKSTPHGQPITLC